jgi:hypothetical protein
VQYNSKYIEGKFWSKKKERNNSVISDKRDSNLGVAAKWFLGK